MPRRILVLAALLATPVVTGGPARACGSQEIPAPTADAAPTVYRSRCPDISEVLRRAEAIRAAGAATDPARRRPPPAGRRGGSPAQARP